MKATSKDIPWAVAEGEITIGEGESALKIPCAVLEDGTRVLWQQGFFRAIGRTGRAAARAITDSEGLELPVFLRASNLKPFITTDLLEASKAIPYRPIIPSRGGGFIRL